MSIVGTSRRSVLQGLLGVAALGLGVGTAAANGSGQQPLRMHTLGLRTNSFEPGSSFKVEIEGVTQGAFASSEVVARNRSGGQKTGLLRYTATDDLWEFRRSRGGHRLDVPLGFFRPEVGDEVVVTVSLFDEADALFGKASMRVKISGFDGTGNE